MMTATNQEQESTFKHDTNLIHLLEKTSPITDAFIIEYKTIDQIPNDEFSFCFHLVESNLREMYEKYNQDGWNPEEKRNEMRQPDTIFLLVRKKSTSNLVGFASFQYSTDDDYDDNKEEKWVSVPVLYVYEIHVKPSVERKGIGSRLMTIMEHLAKKNNMIKIMLTVFTENKPAIHFYRKRGYDEDVTSSDEDDGVNYLILSQYAHEI